MTPTPSTTGTVPGTRPRLVVVADDLTGAADTAAAFGPIADVTVTLDAAAELPAADVVAIDTDSRHRSPEFAARAVRSAVRAATAAGHPLYKKIDSTLRGNIAAEVAAAGHELSATALVCPAFPDTGRTVVGGKLHVHGVPAENGDLPGLFTAAGLRTALLPLATVRKGVSEVVAAHSARRAEGVDVVCADAMTDEDLLVLATAATELGSEVLLTGSAGLARVLARAHSPHHRPRTARPGRVLTVLGSYAPIAREQRAVLATSGEVTEVALKAPFGPAERAVAAAGLAGAPGDALLLPDPRAALDRTRAAEVAAALAKVAKEYVEPRQATFGGLILTGGETARAVLLALDVTEFTVLGEIEPGVVHSLVPALGELPLVTKAGAFGDPATLDRARRRLRRPPLAQPAHQHTSAQNRRR
jgi:D-threonate/D-erythronate kinase